MEHVTEPRDYSPVVVTLARHDWRMIESLCYLGAIRQASDYSAGQAHTAACMIDAVVAFQGLVKQLRAHTEGAKDANSATA